ncbi:MAG: RNA polymerase subunit sigma, partial [Actinobacteria bacterium]|nr:RNA polymerase subunit sigma [Actinomycetota bacterium]
IVSLPKQPFELVSVHDCFRCHPNYGNDLRRQYNTIMADINDSTLLQSMAKQVAHSRIKTKKIGHIDRDAILNSEYMLA